MVAVYAKTLVCCSGRTIPLGGHHAVNTSHTSMLSTVWKTTSERILWIGVTFDYLSATRCVHIKDDVFYGSWSEWRICSYKHVLQFNPRCEVERLSNHPFESTSQNEWMSWPMWHIRTAAVKKSTAIVCQLFENLCNITPPANNFLIICSSCQTLFVQSEQARHASFFCAVSSTYKSNALFCIDRKLTFTVLVIYMVMKVRMSRFISSFSVSSLQLCGAANTSCVSR